MEKWLVQTWEFTRNGYNHPCRLWSDGWQNQVRLNTFCYFGPSWLIQHVLLVQCLYAFYAADVGTAAASGMQYSGGLYLQGGADDSAGEPAAFCAGLCRGAAGYGLV